MTNEKLTYEKNEDEEVDREQPLMSHLLELRSRTVKACASVLVVFLALSPFMKQIFDILSRPLMSALPEGVKMLSTGVVAPFFVPLKVTLFLAFLIALPIVLYQVWAFVAPGLYKKEKRLVFPVLVSSIIMFALGMLYCYFIVFRMVFLFIAGFSPESVNFAPDIDAYFSFVIGMFVAFGLAFEVPIVVVLLNHTGIARYEQMVRLRPYVIVGAFVVAAVVTPPDVLSQCLLAVPLVVLYQVGLWAVKAFGKKHEDSEDDKSR